MKVKLQLDAKSIQAFAIENVEKIGFGVVALLCLLMVYYAVAGMKGYHRTPDELVQAVRKGEEAIATGSRRPICAGRTTSHWPRTPGNLSRSSPT